MHMLNDLKMQDKGFYDLIIQAKANDVYRKEKEVYWSIAGWASLDIM